MASQDKRRVRSTHATDQKLKSAIMTNLMLSISHIRLTQEISLLRTTAPHRQDLCILARPTASKNESSLIWVPRRAWKCKTCWSTIHGKIKIAKEAKTVVVIGHSLEIWVRGYLSSDKLETKISKGSIRCRGDVILLDWGGYLRA